MQNMCLILWPAIILLQYTSPLHYIGDGVPERALVRVHYNGYLEYADEPYDSSRLRGKQQQFVLGNGM